MPRLRSSRDGVHSNGNNKLAHELLSWDSL
ncbi:protein of unknown function [Pararobbsia alpina]